MTCVCVRTYMSPRQLNAENTVGSLDQRDDLLSWGDHSELHILKIDGEAYGMVFFARKRTKYVQIIVSGYIADDKESVESLFRPVLDGFDALNP